MIRYMSVSISAYAKMCSWEKIKSKHSVVTMSTLKIKCVATLFIF